MANKNIFLQTVLINIPPFGANPRI